MFGMDSKRVIPISNILHIVPYVGYSFKLVLEPETEEASGHLGKLWLIISNFQ